MFQLAHASGVEVYAQEEQETAVPQASTPAAGSGSGEVRLSRFETIPWMNSLVASNQSTLQESI